MTAAEPTAEPALRSASKSIVQSMISAAGNTGTEEPPGITAFSRRPPRTPPQMSSSSRNGMPIASS